MDMIGISFFNFASCEPLIQSIENTVEIMNYRLIIEMQIVLYDNNTVLFGISYLIIRELRIKNFYLSFKLHVR